MLDLDALLRAVAENSASDLHLRVGSPPLVRMDGELRAAEGPPLGPGETAAVAQSILPPERWERLGQRKEADFAHSVPGVGRFRVNAYYQRGSISLVFRRVRVGSPSYEELGLPAVVGQLADAPRGLILVTGPTGAGKTTTLAAMIDQINATKPLHILTIEDPIEVLHPRRMASVSQRELGLDTDSYLEAMRSAMRQDPDVILIGEMRDHETVGAALAAGETGHLVLSTLHTTDAVETINRIVDFFPPSHQHQVRVSLSSVLRGVICQRLAPRVGAGGFLWWRSWWPTAGSRIGSGTRRSHQRSRRSSPRAGTTGCSPSISPCCHWSARGWWRWRTPWMPHPAPTTSG